jgi:hypothetical protein
MSVAFGHFAREGRRRAFIVGVTLFVLSGEGPARKGPAAAAASRHRVIRFGRCAGRRLSSCRLTEWDGATRSGWITGRLIRDGPYVRRRRSPGLRPVPFTREPARPRRGRLAGSRARAGGRDDVIRRGSSNRVSAPGDEERREAQKTLARVVSSSALPGRRCLGPLQASTRRPATILTFGSSEASEVGSWQTR